MKEKILIVGGFRYIGSHVVVQLARKKYDVLISDDFSTGHRQLFDKGELIGGRLGDGKLL